MRSISKQFPGVLALDRVSFDLHAGEIHALVGENGAGKSTLMNVLGGVYPHGTYDGEIVVDGEVRRFSGVHASEDAGIAVVHQELSLVPEFSIAENIFLGREPRRNLFAGRLALIDHKTCREQAQRHVDNLHIRVKSVDQKVEELSGGQRQAVAIARATAFDAKVVIMDEPTAALAIKEVGKVLDLIKHLKTQGIGVVLISHRMDDIFYVCDRVVALFHGANFAEARLRETSRSQVIGWIMGSRDTAGELAYDRVR
jgi:simple sugar transport system ATP-binding protein